MNRPRSIAAVVALCLAVPCFAEPDRTQSLYPPERPDDPPAIYRPRDDPGARSAATTVTFGAYTSVQVNVDGLGQNITGDAANEPSIAVSLTDPDEIVIGWRQFDSIASNFRQGGWAYSTDGGQSWTFPGVLTPGIFRSDPVLSANAQGAFYYQSLLGSFDLTVFKSVNGGASWNAGVFAWGGDKNWQAVDTTGGIGDGNVYGIWQRFFGCCGESTLTRSTDDGQSFEAPVVVALRPTFGTMAVGPDGTVYMAGIDGSAFQDFSQFVVAKSPDAEDPQASPTSTGSIVPLGGSMAIGETPNPAGLMGQANVWVDASGGPFDGYVYVVASVDPDVPVGANPTQVHFSRSTDGGDTWDPFVRINDDADHLNHWHWFAAHSVAPNGRIDVIWNDTRNTGSPILSELYYSYSYDAGATWAPNVQISPSFNSVVGHPNQAKIGDYATIVSDAPGASVAYAATFNAEQDVYFVRVFPDCNANGISDVSDISNGTSQDCNASHIPDECEPGTPSCAVAGRVPDGKTIAGRQLVLGRPSPGNLWLNWDKSCRFGDSDYEIYGGDLGQFATPEIVQCSTGGLTEATIELDGAPEYFLIVPYRSDREGSYGQDSSGAARPASPDPCRLQSVGSCPTIGF